MSSFIDVFPQTIESVFARIEQIQRQMIYCSGAVQSSDLDADCKKAIMLLQAELLDELHTFELIFKAKQQGFELPE